jgi:capsule polysaccharide export protein KpsE/RkpR
MRGGIIGLEAEDRNPDFALQLVTVYAQVYSERLAQLARQQTAYKRAVLNDRMGEAAQRLARAQGALDRFRAQNRLPAPDAQLGASVGQLSGLQASLQAKRVELQSALKFATPDNMQVRAIQAEIVSIQTQIAQEQSRRGQTATALAGLSNQHDNLIRDVSFAQSLYQAYSRYLEGSAIEELSAAWNIQQIEPPHIHVGHQINKLPAAILLLILLAAIASEIYLLFPPVGTRVELAARMAK